MIGFAELEQMLDLVAKALGNELLQQVAFVGGCTTGLLITDKVTQEAVRYTGDVDLITHVIGYPSGSLFRRNSQRKDSPPIRNDAARETIIFQRLEALAALNNK